MNDMRGIAQLLQAQGRHGDTMLAHITPEEAGILKLLGGSGTINPETGLPEFFFSIGGWNPFDWFQETIIEPVLEKIIDPVFEFVEEKVIDPILDNPVKAALKAAAIATGNAWAVPVIEGADVARQGGDAGDILAATAASYAMGQASGAVGNVISPEVASAVNSLGLDPATAQVLTDSASRALTSGAMAAATGRDVGAAMTDGAIQGAFKSFTGPPAPTQEDINAIMNLGGTPEQQASTALLDYQTQLEKDLGAAQDQTPQDIYPLDIPQEPPTSYETGIGLPGEEAAAQSQKGFGGTGNILGLEDYEEVAGKDLAEAQAQAGGPDVYVGTQETETKLPTLKLPTGVQSAGPAQSPAPAGASGVNFLNLLGLLGLMQGQQQPMPQAPAQPPMEDVDFVPFERIETPYTDYSVR